MDPQTPRLMNNEESARGRRNGPPYHDFLSIADNLRSSMTLPVRRPVDVNGVDGA